MPLIRKYTEINELNMQMLNELIEKIVVYEKEDNPDGSKSQRVDIHYKFIGYVDIKEMLGLSMVIPMENDITVEEVMDKRIG